MINTENTTTETFVSDVRLFTEAVGCTTDCFNVRQTALYIGLQVEEMAEKLESVFGSCPLVDSIHGIADDFKAGTYDGFVNAADRDAMLDADIDLAWVTVGSAFSQGADVMGAMREVARANMAKLVDCDERHIGIGTPISECPKCKGTLYYAIKDDSGKVKKPADWLPPDLSQFVCKG